MLACEKRDAPAPTATPPTPAPPLATRPDATPALTVRQVCERVGSANCQRAAACSGVSASACLAIVLEQCCASPAACARPAGYSPIEVRRCADAYAQLHCRAIEQGTTPTVCGPMVGR